MSAGGNIPQGKPSHPDYDDCHHNWIPKGGLYFHKGTTPILHLSVDTLYRVHHCEICDAVRYIAEGNIPPSALPIQTLNYSIKPNSSE